MARGSNKKKKKRTQRVQNPFKSKKQRDYLKINNPKIYKRWKKKYGTKVKNEEASRNRILIIK